MSVDDRRSGRYTILVVTAIVVAAGVTMLMHRVAGSRSSVQVAGDHQRQGRVNAAQAAPRQSPVVIRHSVSTDAPLDPDANDGSKVGCRIQVLDQVGNPVEGAEIVRASDGAVPAHRNFGGRQILGVSDGAGQLDLARPVTGFVAAVDAESGCSIYSWVRSHERVVTLQLNPLDREVVGRVLTFEGKPIANAVISLTAMGPGAGGREASVHDRVVSDAEGQFRLVLSSSWQRAWCSAAAGGVTSRPEVLDADRKHVRIEFPGAVRVQGMVCTAVGRPAASCRIVAIVGDEYRETRSAEDGRYELLLYGSGHGVVYALGSEDLPRGLRYDVSLTAGTNHLDIEVGRPATIAGTIGPSTQLRDVWVGAWLAADEDGRPCRRAPVRGDGTFTLPALMAGHQYHVMAFRGEDRLAEQDVDLANSAYVDLEVHDDVRFEVELVDERAEPQQGTHVDLICRELIHREGGRLAFARDFAVAPESGRGGLALRVPHDVRQCVVIALSRVGLVGRSPVISMAAGNRTVKVRLTDSGEIQVAGGAPSVGQAGRRFVRIVSEDSVPLLGMSRSRLLPRGGRWSVPAGVYLVTVEDGDGQPLTEQSCSVLPGVTSSVNW